MSEEQGGGGAGKIVLVLVILMVLGCGGCTCLGVVGTVLPNLLASM
jgi:hypothetical protein